MSDRYSRPQGYGRPRVGSCPIYASIHGDTWDRLEQFRTTHGLTVSGAVHHLLRLQLGLPPLRSLNPENP